MNQIVRELKPPPQAGLGLWLIALVVISPASAWPPSRSARSLAVLAVVVALAALIVSPALLSIARAPETAGRVSSAPSPVTVAPPRCRAFLHKDSPQ